MGESETGRFLVTLILSMVPSLSTCVKYRALSLLSLETSPGELAVPGLVEVSSGRDVADEAGVDGDGVAGAVACGEAGVAEDGVEGVAVCDGAA